MKRRGLTLMELLTVISILATLAALLYPVYTQVKKRVYVIRCATQMKQLGIAFKMYAHDYGDDSPYAITYAEKLYPHYISDERVLVCPYFAAMTPETVEEMHAFNRKRFGYPWSSYETESPRGADEIARKYPDEVISFAEFYSVLGDRVVIAYCSVHRIGCPQGTNFGPSPKGQEFCLKYCVDPLVLRFLSPDQRKLAGEFCDDPPGFLSDLSQPWIILRWDGSVSLDYSGGWKGPETGLREFLEKVGKGK
ncbi:MAG: prepilin-type N-terminal cleavage/methylation domain-containing protein [Armatimonadota bacterium]|nr:prepilin-type N-terminal cleavage/methylation domain-containing protein [Armatimonadota bacterium]